ncbi:hypothetical protein SAMD00019534_018970 [Acytostelium subglobosum LB1]|uniref:hypothetical protein n=1 Tax=Acytostelium subglobosum LB1 TaxID=1410327 RepID=UPI0006451AF7|nr:hypothetical protein SAMD00019534_018970 [Acytostelium subglobosum LB1]GAM18722.1 hypothetical protein SAMD00019534_018970 [Acytostelium subglobosum LB1]|eukprot:XP_012757942.1 hypothetical protein SAMD00019534_018970 [Acytostelium subglobosum LB1]
MATNRPILQLTSYFLLLLCVGTIAIEAINLNDKLGNCFYYPSSCTKTSTCVVGVNQKATCVKQGATGVSLVTKVTQSFYDVGISKTINVYEVDIINSSGAQLRGFQVATKDKLPLRDHLAFWSAERMPNGDFVMPPHQVVINNGTTFPFGYKHNI